MSEKEGKILVVDDNIDILRAAKILLKRHFNSVETEDNPQKIPYLITNFSYDVILLDMNFIEDVSSGKEGFFWLKKILEVDPLTAVVLFTAYGDIEKAVRAMKEGAVDFILKPWDNERLIATLNSAILLRKTRNENKVLKERQKEMTKSYDAPFKEIIGDSDAMKKVFETLEAVAATDANVLILGENGTGKEVVARAIHRLSDRNKEAFVNVDLGAVTETLFESELFGHVKGAFTDAKEDRAGRFEAANGGSLFLDEIGNLSKPLQAKLLSALQTRSITRVGSNKSKKVDIRLVSATNMPLKEMIEEGSFRQDLLYRINTIEVTLPPLRERVEDIPLLVEHYLPIYSKKYNRPCTGIDKSLMNRLKSYRWPGNVRELQHALERAVIMCKDEQLTEEFFFLENEDGAQNGDPDLNIENMQLEEVERILINKVLKKHSGNITYAAKELGLTRASLYRRLEKYGL